MTADVKPLNLGSDTPLTETASPAVEAAGGKPKMSLNLKKFKPALPWALLILFGVATGYGLSRLNPSAGMPRKLKSVEEGITVGSTYGVADEQSFTDSAEGALTAGGIDGEGSHHLVRPGGDSQNVYLTSSIIDLDQFVGRSVKVWGETFQAQKAGWLMDVGRLQVLE